MKKDDGRENETFKTIYLGLAAYSLIFTEESKREQELHRYHPWSGDAGAEHGKREQGGTLHGGGDQNNATVSTHNDYSL